MNANGLNDRTVIDAKRKNNSGLRVVKSDNQNWLSAEISRLPVAEVVASTGMTEKAVQNIRRGKSKISYDNLCELLQNRPDFRTRFFCRVGGELLVRPDQVTALSQAINSIMRGEV